MTAFIEPITLSDRHAALEPLAYDHHDGLAEAVRDGELWKLWYTAVPSPEGMRDEIERRLGLQQAGSMLPFAVRSRASGKLVGMTTYMNIDAKNRRVEIGSTWYAKSAQRTPLNTACKLMLLGACVRDAGLHRGRIPHRIFQFPQPPRDRTPGCEAGRHIAQPPALCRRQPARHRGLFDHCAGMAGGEAASATQTGRRLERWRLCCRWPNAWRSC